MNAEQAAALRAPFPPEAVGKLPRVICPNCSKSPSKVCPEHNKTKCAECGNYMTTRHIHLDYVGHAAVTDRLLQVDPAWTWEPAAYESTGAPALSDGGLWIRLMVCGVTRLGWGDGPDIKQCISDAIRNAAMRFGVGLDLWSKEDLGHDDSAGAGTGRTSQLDAGGSTPPPVSAVPKHKRDSLKARCVALQAADISIADERDRWGLPLVDSCTEEQVATFELMLEQLETQLAELEKPFEVAK